ncbi:MAG: asparagine synthase (glutamine-hydrolyzing), partial [Solirubrobacteraceae bacterium]
MCGIAGILAGSGDRDALRSRAAAMAACLEHRGPNDAGVDAGDGWALAMRRLAVQDTTAAGHQPMRLGDLSLVFNGEVYNFGELREELTGHGYHFRSRSDTEVVLAALEHWGTAALSRFNGMFALALVDRRRRTALLARDRFGKKPLFVARLRDGVLFASELKSLLRVARHELTLCSEALAEYFRFGYVPAPRSIFREVTKLAPASFVEVDLDSGAVTEPASFWSLPEAGAGPPGSSEEVLATVRAAVRRRLVADVPVGAFLSGGTDSSLVVAGMTAAAADVRTFSIGFADPRFDESRYAKAVAAHLGTHHTHQQLEWRDAMALVPALAASYDEPFADSSALPTLAVSRLARQHVTVALSGDGGDELFGGYNRYFGAARLWSHLRK